MEHFKKLAEINVNEKVEQKNGLNYLSWAYAWAETKKQYPNATYEILRFDNKPYIYDENLGYMVFTTVTIEEITHEMWLPVLDGANKSMKAYSYTYMGKEKKWNDAKKKYDTIPVEKTCEPATMFDINKSIMRCLTKNLAMFGLGLYIYAGEDLPITDENEEIPPKEEKQEQDEKKAQKGSKSSEEPKGKQTHTEDKNEVRNNPMTLEQALAYKVEVTSLAGQSLAEIYADATSRKMLPEIYSLGCARTKQAIDITEAEVKRKKEARKKEVKNEIPQ